MTSSPTPDDLREIAFYLPDNTDAPARVECLWGHPVGGSAYRIASIPYYVQGISCGDVVDTANDPELHFVSIKRRSEHSTLRIYLEPNIETDAFFSPLEALGCSWERTPRKQYCVLDVIETCEIADVLDYLTDGQERDDCDWDLGSISRSHAQQLRAVMDADNLPDWLPRT